MGKLSQIFEPTHPRVFVRFGNTKGEIRVKKGDLRVDLVGLGSPTHIWKSFPKWNRFLETFPLCLFMFGVNVFLLWFPPTDSLLSLQRPGQCLIFIIQSVRKLQNILFFNISSVWSRWMSLKTLVLEKYISFALCFRVLYINCNSSFCVQNPQMATIKIAFVAE